MPFIALSRPSFEMHYVCIQIHCLEFKHIYWITLVQNADTLQTHFLFCLFFGGFLRGYMWFHVVSRGLEWFYIIFSLVIYSP